MNKSLSKTHLLFVIFLELLLALPFGFIFTRFTTGGIAWIFGGIASGALVLNACRLGYGYSLKPQRNFRLIGQALVGLAIGFSIAHADFGAVIAKLPVFTSLTFLILITGVLIGYIYAEISGNNLLNAMLATVPGGVGVMSSIAADYGRNVSLVALVQVIRVTAVVLLIPLLARSSMGATATSMSGIQANLFQIDIEKLPFLFLALGITFFAVGISQELKIPAAPFFGSLMVGITFNSLLGLLPFVADADFSPPRMVNLIGQVLLGIAIGEHWGGKPNFTKKTILYALIPVGLTIASGLVAAAIAMLISPWDWLTCMLLTAPGGAPEMILVALALDHHVEIVTAGHLVRLMAINASLPLWVWLFNHLEQRFPVLKAN